MRTCAGVFQESSTVQRALIAVTNRFRSRYTPGYLSHSESQYKRTIAAISSSRARGGGAASPRNCLPTTVGRYGRAAINRPPHRVITFAKDHALSSHAAKRDNLRPLRNGQTPLTHRRVAEVGQFTRIRTKMRDGPLLVCPLVEGVRRHESFGAPKSLSFGLGARHLRARIASSMWPPLPLSRD